MPRHPFRPNEPKWLFRDLKRIHELATTAVFEHYELSGFAQSLILFVLSHKSEDGEIPTQRELAYELNLSPTTITVAVKALVKQGCVRKLTDEEDMRKNRIEITDKGREVALSCRDALDKIDETMYLGFTPEEKELISSFYIRMTDNLKTLVPQDYKKEDNH
jgi:DNA-binding MarR family transcriptional regulator